MSMMSSSGAESAAREIKRYVLDTQQYILEKEYIDAELIKTHFQTLLGKIDSIIDSAGGGWY